MRDVTLDRAVVDYLAIRSLPADEAEHPRVVKAANKIYCDPRGVLWAHDHTGRPTRRIPPIGERRAIIEESMANLLYPSGERLYQHLREQLFWQGMHTECIKYSAAHIARQKEAAKFPSPPYLIPTDKGARPFQMWCVDTIVRLSPPAPNGAQDVVVAVDPTTRWVELGAVPHLTSHEVTIWFHTEIVCRYGLPCVVRSDKGGEYKGEFDRYMRRNGVQHRFTSTMNPRANGLVERVNRIIKSALRRFASECPNGKWWEVLGDIARSLRVLPTRALGYAPYVHVFKTATPLAI